MRTPVVHSPYSTVSASNDHVSVFIRPRPAPMTTKDPRASQGSEAGANMAPKEPAIITIPAPT